LREALEDVLKSNFAEYRDQYGARFSSFLGVITAWGRIMNTKEKSKVKLMIVCLGERVASPPFRLPRILSTPAPTGWHRELQGQQEVRSEAKMNFIRKLAEYEESIKVGARCVTRYLANHINEISP
jgi:hypothetical protein